MTSLSDVEKQDCRFIIVSEFPCNILYYSQKPMAESSRQLQLSDLFCYMVPVVPGYLAVIRDMIFAFLYSIHA